MKNMLPNQIHEKLQAHFKEINNLIQLSRDVGYDVTLEIESLSFGKVTKHTAIDALEIELTKYKTKTSLV